jgi:hypothetical protein
MGTRARKRRNELVTASYAYVRCHGVIDARQCEVEQSFYHWPSSTAQHAARGKPAEWRSYAGETSSPYPYMSHHLHALAA